jgi:hypothetical protein
MDARRNQADGHPVLVEVQANAAGYYGTYRVDPARHLVVHRVVASIRASEAGTLERGYVINADTLVLTADALYEGSAVRHTLVWQRAPDGD